MSTTTPAATTPEPLMTWKVTNDVPKLVATGEGGTVTYQDFVKYKQHLAMYLARFNVQIEDFVTGGRFASVTPHHEVSAGDHSKYVLAFFTVISTGFKDHDIVFAQLSAVLTSPALRKLPGSPEVPRPSRALVASPESP
jgi:hypothetical protein